MIWWILLECFTDVMLFCLGAGWVILWFLGGWVEPNPWMFWPEITLSGLAPAVAIARGIYYFTITLERMYPRLYIDEKWR